MFRIHLKNETELYALEYALEDAVGAQERAAESFRKETAFSEDQRNALIRSVNDRRDALAAILKRVRGEG